MTVKELKKLISNLDDNMRVGGIGHFGEFLECQDIRVEDVFTDAHISKKETILCISIQDAGEEPV